MPTVISVLIPLFNEAEYVDAALESIANQDYPLNDLEIIVALADSDDGTAELLQRFGDRHPEVNLRVVSNPERNTAVGRNRCLEESRGLLVMNFSGHAVADPSVLSVLAAKLGKLPEQVVGIGCRIARATPTTVWGRAIATAIFSPLGGLSQMDSSFDAMQDRPARSVAFTLYKKGVLDELGGFDPEFWCGQDAELNHRLALNGYRIWFTPEATVRHQKRATLTDFAAQMYRYGIARAKITKKYPGSFRIVFLLPTCFVAIALAGIVASFFSETTRWVTLGSTLAFILLSIASAAWAGGSLSAILLSPLVYAVTYFSYGVGLVRGMFSTRSRTATD